MRLGLDLASVESVAETLGGPLAEAYLARIYRADEVADSTLAGRIDPARLAARYAAKEAMVKVLAPGDDPVPLRDIEVCTEDSGGVRLSLHGRAADLAAEAGLTSLAVSLTCDRTYAAAVVMAEVDPAGD